MNINSKLTPYIISNILIFVVSVQTVAATLVFSSSNSIEIFNESQRTSKTYLASSLFPLETDINIKKIKYSPDGKYIGVVTLSHNKQAPYNLYVFSAKDMCLWKSGVLSISAEVKVCGLQWRDKNRILVLIENEKGKYPIELNPETLSWDSIKNSIYIDSRGFADWDMNKKDVLYWNGKTAYWGDFSQNEPFICPVAADGMGVIATQPVFMKKGDRIIYPISNDLETAIYYKKIDYKILNNQKNGMREKQSSILFQENVIKRFPPSYRLFNLSISPDEKYLVYVLDRGWRSKILGYELHLINLGNWEDKLITKIKFKTSGPIMLNGHWSKDNIFYYEGEYETPKDVTLNKRKIYKLNTNTNQVSFVVYHLRNVLNDVW